MAKIQVSPLVSAISGKVGSVTVTRTVAGQVVVKHTAAPKPASAQQQAQSALVAYLARLWASPSFVANIAGWKALALSTYFYDRFMVLRNPTGKNLFTQANSNLNSIGLPVLLTAPSTYSTSSPTTLTVAHTTGPPDQILVTPGSSPGSGEAPVVYACKPCSPGIGKAAPPFSFLQAFAADDAGPYDITTAFYTKYGTPATGRQIIVKCAFIQTATGAKGITITANTLY